MLRTAITAVGVQLRWHAPHASPGRECLPCRARRRSSLCFVLRAAGSGAGAYRRGRLGAAGCCVKPPLHHNCPPACLFRGWAHGTVPGVGLTCCCGVLQILPGTNEPGSTRLHQQVGQQCASEVTTVSLASELQQAAQAEWGGWRLLTPCAAL